MQLHKLKGEKKLPWSILWAKTMIIPPQVHTRVYLFWGLSAHWGLPILGPICTLGSTCILGPICTLGSTCILGPICTLGSTCILGPICTLGSTCILVISVCSNCEREVKNQWQLITREWTQVYMSFRNTSIATALFFVSGCSVIIVPVILILRKTMPLPKDRNLTSILLLKMTWT